MGIDVQLRTESGQVLAEVRDAKSVLSGAVSTNKLSGTRLLRYLVPWGDAMFNQAQAGALALDLRDVTEDHAGKPIAELLLQVAPLVDRLSSDVHAYLWFVGD